MIFNNLTFEKCDSAFLSIGTFLTSALMQPRVSAYVQSDVFTSVKWGKSWTYEDWSPL